MAGRILIVDDVATNRDAWQAMLAAACHQTLAVADGRACRLALRDLRPDLILLNLDLQNPPGPALLRLLRADARSRTVPIIALTARGGAEARIAALMAGADEVLARSVDDSVVLARIRNLLRTQTAVAELGQRDDTLRALGLAETQPEFALPGTIALVQDRNDHVHARYDALKCLVEDRMVVLSRTDTLAEQTPEMAAADIFIIASDLGGPGGGLQLMSELRSHAATRHAGIVLMQSTPNSAEQAVAFDIGANEVLPAGLPTEELALRLRGLMRRKQSADRVRMSVQDGLRLAVIDPLTGLYNRRYAVSRLATIAQRAHELAAGFAVLLVDLDRFKAVNDRHGHAGGDTVLVEIARRLTENLRAPDLLARIGGEEFLVVLPDCAADDAQRVAERLRRVIGDKPVRLSGGAEAHVTASIGVALAQSLSDLQDGSAVLDRADRALLRAKSEGRNQIMLWPEAA
ncbi:diguanylate cyclase response regulator [Gemmobacter aquaticus]|uniref:diguanylate cyclase n=1 Tax=Gemmobacter aquaticus TaxID=490185 RepID=A0A917YKQ0_9RHOB|nr:diguanylate cyclase [Gemmobacter aquaticus]GGO28637.1 diguanylate cyclase response regulator [Gemmobacter aquaticus]